MQLVLPRDDRLQRDLVSVGGGVPADANGAHPDQVVAGGRGAAQPLDDLLPAAAAAAAIDIAVDDHGVGGNAVAVRAILLPDHLSLLQCGKCETRCVVGKSIMPKINVPSWLQYHVFRKREP